MLARQVWKVEIMSELREVTIYTDGSCVGNPGPGGYGVVLQYGNYKKELSGGFRLTTSNRMEIMAAIAGFEVLKEPCSVTLYSDSKYLVDAMTEGWVRRWKLNNWWRNKKERAANIDLWDRLLDLCVQHIANFVWIKGHAGHQWNEKCDALSWKAANQDNLRIDEGYEEHEDQSVTANQLAIEVITSDSGSILAHKGIPHTQQESPHNEMLAQVAPEKSKETGEPSTHDRPKSYTLDEIRQKYPNAYEKWSSEEDGRLKEEYDAEMSIPDLARHFGRQKGAIRARLRKLGVYRKSYTLDEIRQKYPNAYKKWTSEEDRRLKEGYDARMSVPDLAKHFGRQKGAIQSRLRKLGVYRKMSSKKAFADSFDKLSQLAEEALIEHRRGQTRVLDPEQL